MDPMDAGIVMSPENDAVDVEWNAALGYRFWQWLSRLCGTGNTNPESVFDDRTQDSSWSGAWNVKPRS